MRHTKEVPRAALFDFYGTLARWSDRERSGYAAVFAEFGYALPAAELDAYFARYDGIDHIEHSVDAETYEAWARHRLSDLTSGCGVSPHHQRDLIDALRAADQRQMVAYDDAAPTLRALRQAGVTIGVCSNWGWEIDRHLDQVGLLALVDVAVTSARAGARKPHPRMYAVTMEALKVDAGDVIFVGDSWGPDVMGPTSAGMSAVHLWREDERPGDVAPALGDGMHRIGDLRDVLDFFVVS